MKKVKQWVLLATLLSTCIAPRWAVAQDNLWAEGPIACYETPAISSVPRMPDRLPTDARLSSRLRVALAKGEFEPASFVIAPRANIPELQLEATALIGKDDAIPAANVDIKVVKCWYQAGTAWYSYFADSNRRQLVPELLLNDEKLVKVDREKQENYLRVGDDYVWISYPEEKAETFFNHFTEPVADSETLQPIALTKGENKQIWVTVKAPTSIQAGVYTGKINLIAAGATLGSMTLTVRVLPFELPMPKTYYNLDNDYFVTIQGTDVYDIFRRMGIPREAADIQQKAIYKNILEHNAVNCLSSLTLAGGADRETLVMDLRHELRMQKEAGFGMKPLFSRGWAYLVRDETMEQYKARIDLLVDTIAEELGHKDIYITSWSEASVERTLAMRDLVEYAHSRGIKFWIKSAAMRNFTLSGYFTDYAIHGGWPDKENADRWHALGVPVASYAAPHTGPENPVAFRRMEGLSRYKARYDGSFNYIYHSSFHPTLYVQQKTNVWNDFNGGSFRQFNLVYPVKGGVIDTLAWEGYREGIDDVRYATKLKQEAARAIASGNLEAAYAAKKALVWLELLDAETADLNAARMEMIEYILKIQKTMEK